MSEAELIKGCVANNAVCQRELFERFAGKMLVVCMRYSSNRMAAEDILQEGFIKVFKAIHSFKQEGSFEGWVRRIMVNTALSNYRLLTSQNEISLPDDLAIEIMDESVVDRTSEEDLLKLIASLPQGYKTVFNLFAIEGYSHKEIAEMLHINEGTSRSQFSKARVALQQKLKQLEVPVS